MLIDIAFNASSTEFNQNFQEVFEAATKEGVLPLLVGVDLDSSRMLADLAERNNTYSFFGIHPTHFINAAKKAAHDSGFRGTALFFGPGDDIRISAVPDSNSQALTLYDVLCSDLLNNKYKQVLAIGECGLDYYRRDNAAEQISVFKAHLRAASDLDLPLFLHCRHAFADLIACLQEQTDIKPVKGVVHSFDGTLAEAQTLIRMGFFIGINGCSMRTEENVCTVREIPLERILLETDSPYCLIRKGYAASRYAAIIKAKYNEPRYVKTIAEALANIKDISLAKVEETTLANTLALFPVLIELPYLRGTGQAQSLAYEL